MRGERGRFSADRRENGQRIERREREPAEEEKSQRIGILVHIKDHFIELRERERERGGAELKLTSKDIQSPAFIQKSPFLHQKRRERGGGSGGEREKERDDVWMDRHADISVEGIGAV